MKVLGGGGKMTKFWSFYMPIYGCICDYTDEPFISAETHNFGGFELVDFWGIIGYFPKLPRELFNPNAGEMFDIEDQVERDEINT